MASSFFITRVATTASSLYLVDSWESPAARPEVAAAPWYRGATAGSPVEDVDPLQPKLGAYAECPEHLTEVPTIGQLDF